MSFGILFEAAKKAPIKFLKKNITHCLLIKFISVATAFCFLFSSVLSQAVHATIEVNKPQIPKNLTESSDFSIPSILGKITSANFFGSDKIVINIQDLHCHPEVQKNIAQIIELIDKKYKIGKVYLEGASKDIDTSCLNAVTDESARKQIVEALLNCGRLTGAEYYSIKSNQPLLIKGLENADRHKENVIRLGKIIGKKEYFAEKTDVLRKNLNRMKALYLNGENIRFNKVLSKYKEGKLSTEKYYLLLNKIADKINNSSKYNKLFVISKNNYPNINAYLELTKLSKMLRYSEISNALSKTVSELKQRMPYAEYSQLIKETDNFSKMSEFYARLPDLCARYRIDISRAPSLNTFLAYLKKNNQINPIEMIKEERRLIEEVRVGLSADIAELEVSFLVDFFGYFEDYLNNKLSSEDYEYFTVKFPKFKLLWGKYVFKNTLNELEEDFKLFNDYYRVNNERNEYFIEKTVSNFKNDCSITEELSYGQKLHRTIDSLAKAKEIYIVIAGGFHTEGFCKLLEKKKISYLSITPNVTIDTKLSNRIYTKIALEQSKMFSSQSLSMLPSLADAKIVSIGEDGSIVLRLYGKYDVKFIKKGGKYIIDNLEIIELLLPEHKEYKIEDNLKAAAVAADIFVKALNALDNIPNPNIYEFVISAGKFLAENNLVDYKGDIIRIAKDPELQQKIQEPWRH